MPTQSKSSSAELRGDIDRGLTGDKVAAEDPAAAPLGTDDEAAGTPTPPEVMAQVLERELEQGRQLRRGRRTRGAEVDTGSMQWLLIAAFLLALLALAWLAAQYMQF